jgi:hypothetical protein
MGGDDFFWWGQKRAIEIGHNGITSDPTYFLLFYDVRFMDAHIFIHANKNIHIARNSAFTTKTSAMATLPKKLGWLSGSPNYHLREKHAFPQNISTPTTIFFKLN